MQKRKLVLPMLVAALWMALNANAVLAADKDPGQQNKETVVQQDAEPGPACGTGDCCAMHGKMKHGEAEGSQACGGAGGGCCATHGGKGREDDACPMHKGMKRSGTTL